MKFKKVGLVLLVLIGIPIISYFIGMLVLDMSVDYGCYYHGVDLIVLNPDSQSYTGLKYSFIHEYGHYVWDDMLNKSMREKFTKLSDPNNLTCYFGYNDKVKEDFADTFATFKQTPSSLYRCHGKFNYMNEVVRISNKHNR